MDYALLLLFDNETEQKLNKLINIVADGAGNHYMRENKIPPHITICGFNTDKVDKIIDLLDGRFTDFEAGGAFWTSLGAFVPNVLFAAPVLDKYLLNACVTANELMKGSADCFGHYLPHQWVPHTTLAAKLENAELDKAFSAAARHFFPFGGKIVRLELARCEPYKALKVWDLWK